VNVGWVEVRNPPFHSFFSNKWWVERFATLLRYHETHPTFANTLTQEGQKKPDRFSKPVRFELFGKSRNPIFGKNRISKLV